MADRLKGQDVSLAIMQDGTLESEIDTIQSAEIEFELELLEEGYLGETSDRVDSVFKTMRIEVKGHVSSTAYLDLANGIVLRAQRRAGAAVRIDIVGTFVFPDGGIRSIIIPDVHFEAIPLSIGGREEFVDFTLSGKARGYVFV